MSNPDAPDVTAANSGGQQPPRPVQIAFVLYPGFTALDIIGPFQVLAFAPGHEAMFVAAEAGPVTDDTGRCQLTASASFGQVTSPDVVVIGGTLFNEEPDQRVVQRLRQVHPTTTWTTSVCAGSIYLAAAGILDGQPFGTGSPSKAPPEIVEFVGSQLNILAAAGHAAAMPPSRRLVTSGSPLEPEIGFSRAVRAGPYVCVAGTAPIAEGGGTAAPGDVYGQSVRCLDIAEQALHEAGAALADVVRTRVMLTDIRHWKQAARAHAERFAEVRPATTFIEVSRFVDPQWLVEFEVDAIIAD